MVPIALKKGFQTAQRPAARAGGRNGPTDGPQGGGAGGRNGRPAIAVVFRLNFAISDFKTGAFEIRNRNIYYNFVLNW